MEHCQVCGKGYLTIYHVPDEIWRKITPKKSETGLLCIECADKRAWDLGITLYWKAQEEIDVLDDIRYEKDDIFDREESTRTCK